MRLYAFTDLHGNKRAFAELRRSVKREKPRLLICTGDLTIFEHEMAAWLKRLDKLGVETLMLHGNHESEESMRRACAKTKHIRFLHKELARVEGWTFAAYGGGGFEERYPELELLAKKEWKGLPWKKTILLSHAPPYATRLDDVGELEEAWHVGSKTLRTLIKRKKPLLVLAGHIHDCFGASERLGRSLVENPGPAGKLYDLEELEREAKKK